MKRSMMIAAVLVLLAVNNSDAKSLHCITEPEGSWFATLLIAQVHSSSELGDYQWGRTDQNYERITSTYLSGHNPTYISLYKNGIYGDFPAFMLGRASSRYLITLLVPRDFVEHRGSFQTLLIQDAPSLDGGIITEVTCKVQ